ncbi:MAG TPA: OsmC family peroxiredoxin [Vicinamibacterales bacterium]|nr:OsmC family peroxiredoxin [Vicinamibacterales bacterium]
MPTFSRHATVDWTGTLLEGGGELKGGTGAFTLPVSFPRRIGDAQGGTSPEELIAAAHATCYAMVVAGALAKAGASSRGTRVTCTVTADKSDAGIKITTSNLEVVADGLTGMDAATFEKTAREAEGRCPVSNALRGSMAIEVHASAS